MVAPAPRCRVTVPAVLHLSGGRPAGPPGAAGLCVYRTGFPSFEPTMGVAFDGSIFVGGNGGDRPDQIVRRSRDGGRTWQDISPAVDLPAVISDPYLALDRATGRIFMAQLKSDQCGQLSFSDDGGRTWLTNPRVCGLFDHETVFTASPRTVRTASYPRVVYYCAASGGIGPFSLATGCLRSLDGGLSFAPSGDHPFPPRAGCDGLPGHGVAAPNGTILLPKGWCGEPYLAISGDDGTTWTRVRVPGPRLPPGAHEAAVAVDSAGTIYYVWVASDLKPYLAISRTGGATWGRPMMIGAPGLEQAALAGIDVVSPGKVAVEYMGGPPVWSGSLTVSANALSRTPLWYSAAITAGGRPIVREGCDPAGGCNGAGDFFDVTIAPDGTAWAVFVDSCAAPCRDPRLERVQETVLGRFVGVPSLR